LIERFELCRRDVANGFEQLLVIEPVDPFEHRVFDGFPMPPGAATVNELGLVEPDDRFGQRVVVGVTHAAHRRLGAGLRVADRPVTLNTRDALKKCELCRSRA
jgi:hypothetical protein